MAAVSELDPEAALRELLSAWRLRKQPELAARIEALSARLGEARPDPEGKRVKDRAAAWDALAAAADPADFARLARTLFVTTSGADVGERLLKLAAWPPDPRLSGLLHELALRVPFTASSARPFYKSLFFALARVADPRTLDALPAIEAKFADTFADRPDYDGYLARQCAKLRVAVVAAGPALPLDDADHALLHATEAWLDPPTPAEPALPLEALFDLVYDDPDADGPCFVLADALQQAGDPRGELIALQLLPKPTPAQKKRAKQLIDAHADALLGPLAAWTQKKGRSFERGFLAACTYAKAKGTGDVAPPVTRAWSTVREVEGDDVPEAAVRQMTHARHVGGLALADLPGLGHREPLPALRTLRARGRWSEGLVDAIGALPALPGLQRLRIQVLGSVHAAPTPAEVNALARALTRVPSLRLDVPPFDVRLEGPDGARAMRLEFNHGFEPDFRAAIAQLKALVAAVRGVSSVHVHSYDVGWLAREADMLARLPIERLRKAAAPLPVTQTAEVREEGGWAAREREV